MWLKKIFCCCCCCCFNFAGKRICAGVKKKFKLENKIKQEKTRFSICSKERERERERGIKKSYRRRRA